MEAMPTSVKPSSRRESHLTSGIILGECSYYAFSGNGNVQPYVWGKGSSLLVYNIA